MYPQNGMKRYKLMTTNCIPLLVDIFPYLYEADFIKKLLNKYEWKLAGFCHFTCNSIDDFFD